MRWEDYFIYNPDTGKLYWKYRNDIEASRRKQWNACNAGNEVGHIGGSGGYLNTTLTVGGKRYNLKVHRICYEMYYGPIPEGKEVDHINHIKTDNRAVNLGLKDHKDNMRNMSLMVNNTSGCAGIHKNKHGKWVVRIGGGKRGKRVYIGCFSDINDAIKARRDAEKEYGYHENHGK
ncbi:HNH endonuclease [Escherichia coli]|uniref:HNH endonuclease n=1 Tax=Escherichia coli TaxID=562 RepID=UPI0036D79DFF